MTAPAGEPADGGSGRAIHALIEELYPICRSITGDGVRETLARIGRVVPISTREVPTGTAVYDWTVPKEWNIRDAYIKNANGKRVVDFRRNSLHVVNYSTPIKATLTFEELRPHLFSIPEHPSWIPYRTSYYSEAWGFCLSHEQLLALQHDGPYEVCIDSSLADGHLTYGECFLPGATADEVLISCHVCHPALCNDNLSGIGVAAFLAHTLAQRPHRRYSYRFLFIPATIGAITWLAGNEAATTRIRHGLVLSCLGDPGAFTYKRSRRGDAEIDRAASSVLRDASALIEDFSPYGYDERQFCSPGFNLAMGCLMRTGWGRYPEYHSSADNLQFVTPQALAESLETCVTIIDVLERNVRYHSTNPRCEPALGRRGLYRTTGGAGIGTETMALLWVLNFSDGEHSLLDITERSGLAFAAIATAADTLSRHGLLVRAT